MGVEGAEPEVEISNDPAHGEYTTNVALRLFSSQQFNNLTMKQFDFKSPRALALQVKKLITYHLSLITSDKHYHNIKQKHQSLSSKSPLFLLLSDIDRVEVAGPGFLNFFLNEAKLITELTEVLKHKDLYGKAQTKKAPSASLPRRACPERAQASRRIMVEFAHPNTHKAFHIGHLRNITTGESIVRLLESQGIEVIRANYQGDVGLHIAKALYALLKLSAISRQLSVVRKKGIQEKVEFLGQAYAAGSKAFEDPSSAGLEAKKAIARINAQIYAKDPQVYPLYQETRQWSLDYFAKIYQRVGSHFDRLYFESEVYESGKQYVREGLKKGIFAESEGAVIFPGEKFQLHNRVFITQDGNATYEAKDMGLGRLQFDVYHPGLIIHVVGPEQKSYFQVVFEALAQLFPETRGKEYHLIYGWVRLKHGKMSSRSGQVVTGEWLLDEAKRSIHKIIETSASPTSHLGGDLATTPRELSSPEKDEIAEKAAVAAVKYAFLKVSTKQEIAFDLKESVSLEGDSGPYLLYTYARSRSVLRKAGAVSSSSLLGDLSNLGHLGWNPEEKNIARLLHFFPEIVASAAAGYAPNTLCSYLFHLAQTFNLFYQKHPILSLSKDKLITDNLQSTTSKLRLGLTAATAQVLHNGLYLLGIPTIERM